MPSLFRSLPSVDACLTALTERWDRIADFHPPHALVRERVNAFLDGRREAVRTGLVTDPGELSLEALIPALDAFVRESCRPELRRVLNATGVVIHTNLGRSVLADEALRAVHLAASGYCNLEYNLATGERGSRHALVEGLIRTLTGAEAALVVNNNAAAVLLMLDTLCSGGEVVVSRGQLVEIGGSFRIPEVMARSGALLREVGTTNRTHLSDYAAALHEGTRALLRVHTSNYRIVGFHADVPLAELAALARDHSLPLLEDLGSGSFVDFSPWGLPGEPTAREILAAGADVVTFSGDKVLGGPQAGIIAGKARYIEPIRRNQLLRALRCDKMTLAALEATLRLYLDPKEALRRIPTLRRMTMPPEELRLRARRLARLLRQRLRAAGEGDDPARISLVDGVSRVGGGSFPERDLPTTLVQATPLLQSAENLRARLLKTDPPLVGRVERDAFLLDPRTLKDQEFGLAAKVVAEALAVS